MSDLEGNLDGKSRIPVRRPRRSQAQARGDPEGPRRRNRRHGFAGARIAQDREECGIETRACSIIISAANRSSYIAVLEHALVECAGGAAPLPSSISDPLEGRCKMLNSGTGTSNQNRDL